MIFAKSLISRLYFLADMSYNIPMNKRKATNMAMNDAILSELRAHFGKSKISSTELHAYNPKYMNMARAGGLEKVGRGLWSLGGAVSAPKTKADRQKEVAAKGEQIRERFSVLEMLAGGVVDKNIRGLIVAGAPGVGKTFTLEQVLEKAEKQGKVSKLEVVKGSISAIGLYLRLWETREAGQVLVLDDIDEVFNSEEAMNLLKGALDTTKVRRISWAKASSFLRDQDIPNSFDYNGQIVFITNKDPDGIIAKGGKLAPHMNALVSRSVFLDLCIHDNRSIMIRVEQVLADSEMINDLGVTRAQAADMVGWMNDNLDRLRAVSLRSMIQLAGYVKTTPNWVMLANNTMLVK